MEQNGHRDPAGSALGGVFSGEPIEVGLGGKTFRLKAIKLGQIKGAADRLMASPFVPQQDGNVTLGYVAGAVYSGFEPLAGALGGFLDPEPTVEDLQDTEVAQLDAALNAVLNGSGIAWLRDLLGNRKFTAEMTSYVVDEMLKEQRQSIEAGGASEQTSSPSSTISSSTSPVSPRTPTRPRPRKGSPSRSS